MTGRTPQRTPRIGLRRARCCAAVLVVLLLASLATAMETDQFLALDAELADSSAILNDYVNGVLERRLALLNHRRSAKHRTRMSCDEAVQYAFAGFRRAGLSRVAHWAHADARLDRHPSRGVGWIAYYRRSVLGVPYYSAFGIPLGRTINVGGVHLGTDKLSHFLSVGARYHRRYVRARRRGLDDRAAEDRAIRWGLKWENSLLGSGATGVLSFGDLEANYQGLVLARALCGDRGPVRVVRDGHSRFWLDGQVDVRDYVNPDWDETFNPNVYSERRWKRIRRRIATHCAKLELPAVVERFRTYRRDYRPSRNERFMRALERRDRLPGRERFALFAVCAAAEP